MRILVIGGGSIGRRHLTNLRALGQQELALAEPDSERRQAVCDEVGAAGFADESASLTW